MYFKQARVNSPKSWPLRWRFVKTVGRSTEETSFTLICWYHQYHFMKNVCLSLEKTSSDLLMLFYGTLDSHLSSRLIQHPSENKKTPPPTPTTNFTNTSPASGRSSKISPCTNPTKNNKKSWMRRQSFQGSKLVTPFPKSPSPCVPYPQDHHEDCEQRLRKRYSCSISNYLWSRSS